MNTSSQSQIEFRILIVSAAACLLIACVALVASSISGSQAILLDGLFNLSYFVASLFTLKVSRLVLRGDDVHFPYGYGFFEPLINGIKGLLILGVSIMALIAAVQALLAGGRSIEAGIATAYGAFATITGWAMAWITHRGYRRSKSPLIKADADGWVVNAAISSAVLLAFAAIWILKGTPYAYLTPYMDPAVALIVVLISLSVPIRMAWTALMALLNRAPPPAVTERARKIIHESLDELPVRELFVRVLQPGRTQMIMAHVVMPEDYAPSDLKTLDSQRERTLDALKKQDPDVFLDMLFTTDRIWGAPLNESANP